MKKYIDSDNTEIEYCKCLVQEPLLTDSKKFKACKKPFKKELAPKNKLRP
jgi:hypothetical protein